MDCTACQAGEYCPAGAQAASTCQTNYFSAANAISCTACPAGKECPDATAAVACGAGTYSLGEQIACLPCPPGESTKSLSKYVE